MDGMSLYGFSRSSMAECCITDISLSIEQAISGSGILFCNKSSCIERVARHSLTRCTNVSSVSTCRI